MIEGYKRGTKIYLLDDPKGHTWVLPAYTAQAAPKRERRRSRIRSATG